MFVVSTGYAAYAPNPVNLLFDKMSDQQLDRDDIVCIDIARSCAEITLRDGHTIAAFTSCGHAYDDSTGQASQNSASLLSDLTDGAITTAGYFAVNMSSFCQMTWQRDRGGSWNRHPRIIRR
ncbi:hypothetical protein A3E76_04100 [Candidatus Saccharibacteria bacterium RIFCSPHIGHO2_12_FULL_44_22]|nr:MAG: hypothetical protein A3E76_04100 [Candidatus Saccharibacteria bacterium RIFCSPHIGHO2_12_FULL_44_22]